MHDKSRARGRAAAGVLAGCAVGLALVTAPAQALAARATGTPAPGTITTLAGGVGGPALATQLVFGPLDGCAIVNVASGHLYLGDQFGEVIRVIDARTDELTTPAGDGSQGFQGDHVRAVSTELDRPCAATIDGAGNLVIADKSNGRVRVVAKRTGTFYGQHMVGGDIYTVAMGSGPCLASHTSSSSFCPADVTTNSNGNILVSSSGTEQIGAPSVHQILTVPVRSGTFYGKKMVAGKKYLLAKGGGSQIAVDHAGNILMAASTRVKVLAEKTGRFYGLAMKRGHTYVVAGNGKFGRSSGNGGPARKAGLNGAEAVAVDHSGNVVIGAVEAEAIRVVARRTGAFYGQHMKAGDIYQIAGGKGRLAGNGVPAANAFVGEPTSVAIDGQGNVVFTTGFTVRAIAERAGVFYGQHMKSGDVYTVAGNPQLVPYDGEGAPATSAQRVSGGLARDGAGNLLIAHTVVRVIAAATGTFYGKAMIKGHLYTIAGSGARDTGGGAVGDGGPASKAKLSAADVAVDVSGNLVVTDSAGHRIRVVAARTGMFYGQSMTAGDIYTVAGTGTTGFSGDGGAAVSARIRAPQGVAIDAAGNLVFIDIGSGRVRVAAAATGTFYGQSMTSGDIYTIAGCPCGTKDIGDGGPALAATFKFAKPAQLAMDADGNLVVVADDLVRVIAVSTGTFYGQPMTAGDVYAVAGTGVASPLANGVPATTSSLKDPSGVTVDGHGNLIVGDTGDQEVRIVAATTGTFYGKPMTAGDIYALAGHDSSGLTGDGGPGTSAKLDEPEWVTVDPAGNVIFDDDSNHRIRQIQG